MVAALRVHLVVQITTPNRYAVFAALGGPLEASEKRTMEMLPSNLDLGHWAPAIDRQLGTLRSRSTRVKGHNRLGYDVE